MKDLLKQTPFDKFLSPVIPYIPQSRRRAPPRIEGVSRFIEHLKAPRGKGGLFVVGAAAKTALEEAFHEILPIKDIRVLSRYAFVELEDGASIDCISGKWHRIGGKPMYVDYVRGSSLKFVPKRLRNRTTLWHNHKNKFK
ncbi:hypothetical protein [Encephalitozoon cuniculi GB-M1]|uniref:Uncharacterized protein n=1 Tax=Encephalitozoon cuniculi (strain GB-M1) TaxID=284813 RepID=Q8SU69_ENCCU|nr:uncharacterized protein ECU11_0440 [Encephalitozoon cuniculi GB-M1]CAD25954.1 hypothetical protein [Encephalitozoon cuniculi GB-M1]